jgi:hypothetical protein
VAAVFGIAIAEFMSKCQLCSELQLQSLRDWHTHHTEQSSDMSGIGRFVTALAGKKLNHLVKEVRKRRIVSTDGYTTIIGWKKGRRQGGDAAPWVDGAHSKHLMLDDCNVALVPVAGSGHWRAVCRNHTCCRDFLPCSGLLALYANKCVEGDVHPRWLLSTHNGANDSILSDHDHGYLGLDVSPLRADMFGCTPEDRRLVGDLVGTLGTTIADDDVGTDTNWDTADPSFDLAPDVVNRARPLTQTVPRAEMLAAANRAIRHAGDSRENRQFLIDEFDRIGEEVRSRNSILVPNSTVQERSILRSPSNASSKIG